jgi:hypothetical protein
MTMRRGHHTSGVLKALGAAPNEPAEESAEPVEQNVAFEPE